MTNHELFWGISTTDLDLLLAAQGESWAAVEVA